MRTRSEVIQSLKDGKESLSHSSFSAFMKSPFHFMVYKTSKPKPTPAMISGSYFHCYLLEPEKVQERFAVIPSDIGRKTEHNEAWQQFQIDNAGKDFITTEIVEKGEILRDRMNRNDSAGWLWSQIEGTEVEEKWEAFGFNWRGFIDAKGKIIFDLKQVPDADPKKVRWQIRDRRMIEQAAHYTIGAGNDLDYYVLAFDLNLNFSVIHIQKPYIEQKWEDMKYYVSRFKQCIFLNQWDASYDFWAKGGIYNYSQL